MSEYSDQKPAHCTLQPSGVLCGSADLNTNVAKMHGADALARALEKQRSI